MYRTTLEDVAKRAGVSTKTVSRVLNNEPNVAADTYEKVKIAIADLNYVPNIAARNLSRGKAMALGLVIGWPVNNPYSSSLIDYTLRESMHDGYGLSLFSIEDGATGQIIQAFRGRQIDGIILDTNPADDEDLIAQLNALKVPYLVVNPNRKGGHRKASFVEIDNEGSAKEAVNYLIQLGHTSIGYISDKSEFKHLVERLRGYRKALADSGIPFRKEWVFEDSGLTFQIGFTGTMHLLSKYKEITAVFCGTDDMAMGAMSAIYQLGLNIPNDISLVGFDDIFYASIISPPLTTIHQPIDEIARTAVKQLIKMIDDPNTEPVELILPTRLVIRETCKSPSIRLKI